MKFNYTKATPDLDSYGKFLIDKTKPTIKVLLRTVVGMLAVSLFGLLMWIISFGFYRLGWYVGCALNIFDASKVNDHHYTTAIIGPAPWIVGLGTVVLPILGPFILYKIGSFIIECITDGTRL